jgi:hypothetical protein
MPISGLTDNWLRHIPFGFFSFCLFPFLLLSLLPLSVYAPSCLANTQLCQIPFCLFPFMPLSFMPLSGFEQIELCLFPLCHFPLRHFPVWNEMNYASFLYASFRFCPFPFMPLSGWTETADYARFFYAKLPRPRFSCVKLSYVNCNTEPVPVEWFISQFLPANNLFYVNLKCILINSTIASYTPWTALGCNLFSITARSILSLAASAFFQHKNIFSRKNRLCSLSLVPRRAKGPQIPPFHGFCCFARHRRRRPGMPEGQNVHRFCMYLFLLEDAKAFASMALYK